MPTIVTINVTQQTAPTPSMLQRTGAFISQGGTSLAAGQKALLTELSDLTPLYNGAIAITNLVWASTGGGIATATLSGPHGIPLNEAEPVRVTIAGVTPSGWNGTFNATATGANTLTFPLAANPGSITTAGMLTIADVSQLCAMATTFFANGAIQSVYVLELGPGDPADGVAALAAYLTANPNMIYAFLVPREWDTEPTYIGLVSQFQSPNLNTYFFTTTTVGTYARYTSLQKAVFALIEAPNIPTNEFSLAAAFQAAIRNNPSATNKLCPYAFTELFDVTPYPTAGNAALLQTLKNANINVIGTGAEGGISDAILLWGTMADGNDFTYWYSVDWIKINCAQAIANAVINGSNNPVNPLYLDQDGINRVQDVIVNKVNAGVSFGMVLGTAVQEGLDSATLNANLDNEVYAGKSVVNAIPFIQYFTDNPGHYKIGEYDGYAVLYIPKRGFIHILLNIVVSQFVTTP